MKPCGERLTVVEAISKYLPLRSKRTTLSDCRKIRPGGSSQLFVAKSELVGGACSR